MREQMIVTVMKILHVSHEGRLAGAERSLLLLLRHLRGRVESVVTCPAGSDLADICREQGVACESLPVVSRGHALSLWKCLRATRSLRRIVRRVNPDIIHANNIHAMAIASLSRGLCGSRLIWHVRDVPKPGFVTRWCAKRADRLIAVSNAVKGRLMELNVNEQKIDMVYNGVDMPTVNMPSIESDDGPNRGDSFTFACVGQIVRWKNQEDFLKAAEIVHRQFPEAKFLLVGSDVFKRRDSYQARLRDMIESRRISYVQCIGWQKDMEPIWRRTDCLVHTANMEPFGRVVIEAMAHGRPVVAYACGGPAEIVDDGRFGLLVPFGDVDALAAAMLRIAREGGLAEAMGQAASQRVRECFGADKTAEGVMTVYQKLLEER